MRTRPLSILVLAVGFLAHASPIPKQRSNVATTTARFCAAGTAARVSIQCEYPVYVATGKKLADAGTARTTDAGAPIVANPAGDELVAFPGDRFRISLGTAEQCVGVLSQDAGDGGNNCNFFEANDSP